DLCRHSVVFAICILAHPSHLNLKIFVLCFVSHSHYDSCRF
uniref:Ovule protein n=1 Tax=Ascaris lumbricoides TaxID=6252 RepID=A0A0M3HMF9_ASCLU